jgi:branched-chain amino acid transport system permease protein
MMTAELFTQLLVNGLAIGLIYVLVASGLIILLGVVRIFNFAHAEFYMLGAFITFGACEILHLNFFLSIAIAVVVVTILGALCYGFIFRYLQGDILLCTGASIGLSMILMRGALLGFGTQERGLRPPFPGNIGIGFVTLPAEKVIAIVLCLAVMIGLYFFLMRTKIGKAMRAVKQDTEVAALQGINTKKIYTIAFASACALAGLAGGIVAPVFSVTPAMGHNIFLKCLMVLTVGGMQSMLGGVIGGVVVGLITSFGMFYMGGLTEILIFGIIGVVLAFKPFGIFGAPH